MATSHDTLLSQIADDDETFNSLIQQLVADRKAYLATVEKIQGSLGQVRQGLHSQPHISSPETTSTLQPPISSQAARPLAEVALAAGLSELPSILNSRQSSPVVATSSSMIIYATKAVLLTLMAALTPRMTRKFSPGVLYQQESSPRMISSHICELMNGIATASSFFKIFFATISILCRTGSS